MAYGNQELNTLCFGSPFGDQYEDKCRGGGIIELIATKIINNGKITCNGYKDGCSGGSIKIRCKVFVNNGMFSAKGGNEDCSDKDIGAGAYGRICIECLEYKNNGIIYPDPYIKNMKYNQKK
eukprot:99635_1